MEFIKIHFSKYQIHIGKRGEPFPKEVDCWSGDFIVSYLSPWIIPEYLLNKASISPINFHPGPPEYPGIGCTNFAIYDQVDTFGITCHYMNPKVDTGKLVAVRRFPLYKTDTVYSLTQRCYGCILSLFYEIMSLVLDKQEPPQSDEGWKRKPFTRQELNNLCRISPDMSEDEIKRRVKSVTFPNAPGAYTKIGGVNFIYEGEECQKQKS